MNKLPCLVKLASLLIFLTAAAEEGAVVNVKSIIGKEVKLKGVLGLELGEIGAFTGLVVPSRNWKESANMFLPYSINNHVTQEPVEILIREDFFDLDVGVIYELNAFETGAFVGYPKNAFTDRPIDSPFFHFRNELSVVSCRKREGFSYHPKDFINRKALLTGVAFNRDSVPMVNSKNGWSLKIEGAFKWSEHELGKNVEVFGMIKRGIGESDFIVLNGRYNLTELADQIGKEVNLKGFFDKSKRRDVLNYRGTEVKLLDLERRYSTDDLLQVSGILETNTQGDNLTYVIRNPKCTGIKQLLIPEMQLKFPKPQ